MQAELMKKVELADATPKVKRIKPGRYVDKIMDKDVQVYDTRADDQVVYRYDGQAATMTISRPLALLRFRPAHDVQTDEQWMRRQPTGAVVGICTLAVMMLVLAVVLGLVALAVL